MRPLPYAALSLVTLPLVALLAAGCSAVGGEPSARIAGNWALAALDGKPLGGTAQMAIAADGAIEGQAPCNAFSARNALPVPGFRAEALVTTDRQCLWDGGETEFLAAFGAATSATREGEALVIAGPGGSLRFLPAAP